MMNSALILDPCLVPLLMLLRAVVDKVHSVSLRCKMTDQNLNSGINGV